MYDLDQINTQLDLEFNYKTEEDEMAIVEMTGVRLPFLKKEELPTGSIVTIEDEATQGGQFNQYSCTIRLPDGSLRRAGFNTTSLSSMVAAWGNDTTLWTGKKLIFTIEDVTNSRTKQVIKDCKVFRAVA